MNEQYLNHLREQITETEKALASRAEAILSLVQLQNQDRIRLQRLIDLLEEVQQAIDCEDVK